VLIQSNYLTLQNVFSGWQEQISTGSIAVLSKKDKPESPLSVQNDPAAAEKSTNKDAVTLTAESPERSSTDELAAASDVVSVNVDPGTAVTESAPESVQVAQSDTVSSDIGSDVFGQDSVQDDVEQGQTSPSSGNDYVDNESPDMAFAQDAVTVYEGANMTTIMLRRRGVIDAAASVTWWTSDNTAIANQDYADLGVRTETFAAGQESLTIYVPLVSDSLIEETESFYVYVSWDAAPTYVVDRLEVFVVDND
jgi:hypothetical protein